VDRRVRTAPVERVHGPIALRHLTPISSGNNRLIYVHPFEPDYLIKVMRPEVLEARRKPRHFYQRFKRERILGSFVREIREQLILAGHGEDSKRFLQQIVGFCDTDLGIGMVVRAIRGPNGKLAVSLDKLIAEGGFDDEAQRKLDAFCDALVNSRIAISGLFLRNLLYGTDEAGGGRFILVDGFGEGALMRVNGAFPPLNRRSKEKLIGRLRTQVARALRRRPRPSAAATKRAD
jgi:hypothetical protein